VQLFILAASNDGSDTSKHQPALGAVIEQVTASLGLRRFRLLAATIIRGVEKGSVSTAGMIPVAINWDGTPSRPVMTLPYTMQARIAAINAGATSRAVIDLRDFRWQLKFPSAITVAGQNYGQTGDLALSGDIRIEEGVPTLVGTLPTARGDEQLIIIVRVARPMVPAR
jgi:hypothetical protein